MNQSIILYIQSQPIAMVVISILFIMSLLSWYIILQKSITLWWIDLQGKHYEKAFWQGDSLKDFMQQTQEKKQKHPFAYLSLNMIFALLDYKQYIKQQKNPDYRIEQQQKFIDNNKLSTITEQKNKLQHGLTLLASIGSLAPFIGLLGTVLSIYSALMKISKEGNATLQVVAAPIGEALILTAIGLAVAIPAVLGYNLIIKNQKLFLGRLDRFAYYLASYLYTGKKPTVATFG